MKQRQIANTLPIKSSRYLAVLILVFAFAALAGEYISREMVENEWNTQWRELDLRIKGGHKNYQPYQCDISLLNPAAGLVSEDRDPLDIALRRVSMLLEDLQSSGGESTTFSSEADRLTNIRTRAESVSLADVSDRKLLYLEVCQLRREIAFKNPLLDFDKILFIEYPGNHDSHVTKATSSFMLKRIYGDEDFDLSTAGVYVLHDPFGDAPSVSNLLENSVVQNGRLAGKPLNPGVFRGLEVTFGGTEVYFGYAGLVEGGEESGSFNFSKYHSQGSSFGIYKVDVDGSNLMSVLDRPWDDQDPCQLPNGRIVFTSDSFDVQGRCDGTGYVRPSQNLFSMKDDGSDRIWLSVHETKEWEPSVDNDGMIVYTRWDYVDRNLWYFHNLWKCYPDGRDPRAPHGNYAPANVSRRYRPTAEKQIRSIPNSQKYIAIGGNHNQGYAGPPLIIDTRIPDDRKCSQLKFLASDAAYATPWPLSEKYYLISHGSKWIPNEERPEKSRWKIDRHGLNRYSLYLLDQFGNKELLLRPKNREFLIWDAMPQASRPTPPVLSTQTFQGERSGLADHTPATISVTDVYESELPFPEGTRITQLRIVQVLLNKRVQSVDNSWVGYAKHGGARMVLGTVPVEEDGSAFFQAPVGREIYFQALDENGVAVQSMRSGTYVHPGEHLSCLGCHEDKWKIPEPKGQVTAQQRLPSKITAEVPGSRPFSFSRLVQPVLDEKCQPCHEKHPDKAPRLAGTVLEGQLSNNGTSCGKSLENGRESWEYWTESYMNLRLYSFYWDNDGSKCMGDSTLGLEDVHYSIPGKTGALGSKLYPMLKNGHNDVKLTPEEMRRITLWLDCNSDFHGAYVDLESQARGEIRWPHGEVDPANPTSVEWPPDGTVGIKTDKRSGPPTRDNDLKVQGNRITVPAGAISLELLDLRGRRIRALQPSNDDRATGTLASISSRMSPGIHFVKVTYRTGETQTVRLPVRLRTDAD